MPSEPTRTHSRKGSSLSQNDTASVNIFAWLLVWGSLATLASLIALENSILKTVYESEPETKL